MIKSKNATKFKDIWIWPVLIGEPECQPKCIWQVWFSCGHSDNPKNTQFLFCLFHLLQRIKNIDGSLDFYTLVLYTSTSLNEMSNQQISLSPIPRFQLVTVWRPFSSSRSAVREFMQKRSLHILYTLKIT